MHILLWVLQIFLALHTAVGAAWKLSHSPAETMPSLVAISPALWHAMSVIEFACAVALLLPKVAKSLGFLVPLAAAFVILEMLLYGALHLAHGDGSTGPLVYWGVVAAVCAFIAYGRGKLHPL